MPSNCPRAILDMQFVTFSQIALGQFGNCIGAICLKYPCFFFAMSGVMRQFFSTITASKGSFEKHSKYWGEGAVRFDQNWEMANVNYKNG